MLVRNISKPIQSIRNDHVDASRLGLRTPEGPNDLRNYTNSTLRTNVSCEHRGCETSFQQIRAINHNESLAIMRIHGERGSHGCRHVRQSYFLAYVKITYIEYARKPYLGYYVNCSSPLGYGTCVARIMLIFADVMHLRLVANAILILSKRKPFLGAPFSIHRNREIISLANHCVRFDDVCYN